MQVVRYTDDPLYEALVSENTSKVVLDTADPAVKVYITKVDVGIYHVSKSDNDRNPTVVSGSGAIFRAMATARSNYFGAVE